MSDTPTELDKMSSLSFRLVMAMMLEDREEVDRLCHEMPSCTGCSNRLALNLALIASRRYTYTEVQQMLLAALDRINP